MHAPPVVAVARQPLLEIADVAEVLVELGLVERAEARIELAVALHDRVEHRLALRLLAQQRGVVPPNAEKTRFHTDAGLSSGGSGWFAPE